MRETFYRNDGRETVYIGSRAVQPGETRSIDPSWMPSVIETPANQEPSPLAEAVIDVPPLASVLDDQVAEVIKSIKTRDENGAPVIADDDLVVLQRLEEEGRARKTLIKAISEELLDRAAEASE